MDHGDTEARRNPKVTPWLVPSHADRGRRRIGERDRLRLVVAGKPPRAEHVDVHVEFGVEQLARARHTLRIASAEPAAFERLEILLTHDEIHVHRRARIAVKLHGQASRKQVRDATVGQQLGNSAGGLRHRSARSFPQTHSVHQRANDLVGTGGR